MRVEALEARDNPATYYWDPLPNGDLLATNSLIWMKDGYTSGSRIRCTVVDVPTNPAAHLKYGESIPAHAVYQYGQSPLYIPAHYAVANWTLTQASSSPNTATFLGLTLLSTYPGEVDLRQSVTVTTRDVADVIFQMGVLSARDWAEVQARLRLAIAV